eukprot:15874737-Heterocapsa_arctica.AAC.1
MLGARGTSIPTSFPSSSTSAPAGWWLSYALGSAWMARATEYVPHWDLLKSWYQVPLVARGPGATLTPDAGVGSPAAVTPAPYVCVYFFETLNAFGAY